MHFRGFPSRDWEGARWAPGGPLPDAGKVCTGSAQLPVPQLGRCALSSGRSLPEAGKVCIGHRRDRDALAGGPLPEAGKVSFGSVRNYRTETRGT